MEKDLLTSSFLGLRDKLHHIALKYLGSDEDAKDALQDTWLKLRSKGEVETTIEARNKLVTVLRNVCIDHLKKAREIPIDVTVDIQAYRMDEEDIGNLEQLLQEGLTPLQKEIFNLVTHEGFDYNEIAKQLSMSVEAVRMNMSRTIKNIRENYKRLNR